MKRSHDPHVGSSDRSDYLLAASNLASDLSHADRDRHFATALRAAIVLPPSEHDEQEKQFSHRLGAMRITSPDHDSRDRAIFLAACLATSHSQRTEVRRQSFALLGVGKESDYWLTRALQRLGDALKDDLGFLVSQGWALRSLAGILWAEHGGPVHIGTRLSMDPAVRVRRALAGSLAGSHMDEPRVAAFERLAQDSGYSVRAALHGDEGS